MPKICSICAHVSRKKIDEELVKPGASIRGIARTFRVSEDALTRHRNGNHIQQKIVKAAEVREVAEAGTLLDQITALKDRALEILTKAEGDKVNPPDLRTACTAIREVRGILELLAKVTGELNERPQVNILMNPEWVEVRTVILRTLEPFPDARAQLVDALAKVEVQQS